jgi:hypothetical protein
MSKTISRRRGGLRVSKKGKVSYNPGSLRIGGKAGVNLSKRGASASVRTPLGTYNSRSGCRLRAMMLIAPVIGLAGLIVAIVSTR